MMQKKQSPRWAAASRSGSSSSYKPIKSSAATSARYARRRNRRWIMMAAQLRYALRAEQRLQWQ